MRNIISNRRFQDVSAVLCQRDAVLVADRDVRAESASVYSRSVSCQAMPTRKREHQANRVLAGQRDFVVLACFARAEQALWAAPVKTGALAWQQATTGITTQVGTGGKCQGTSFGGAGRMSLGNMPAGPSVRLGEGRPTEHVG